MPYAYDHPRPAVACDIALFARREGRLNVLLVRRRGEPFKGLWALPGGFVEERETLGACAARELAEETGITGVTLAPVANFSDPDRDPRGWTISAAYVGLLSSAGGEARAGDDAEAIAWFDLDALPPLAFDHDRIVGAALAALPEAKAR